MISLALTIVAGLVIGLAISNLQLIKTLGGNPLEDQTITVSNKQYHIRYYFFVQIGFIFIGCFVFILALALI